MSLAAEHAVTVTTHPWGHRAPGSAILEVQATCSCGAWTAAGPVNPLAPAYDPEALPTRLRAMHRDHQGDVLMLGALADADLAEQWDAALTALTGAPLAHEEEDVFPRSEVQRWR